MSFSMLEDESGDNSLRTVNPERVRRAQSLCLPRYSSLTFAREADTGRSLNTDLMTSAVFGLRVSKSWSKANLKRMV